MTATGHDVTSGAGQDAQVLRRPWMAGSSSRSCPLLQGSGGRYLIGISMAMPGLPLLSKLTRRPFGSSQMWPESRSHMFR